MMPSLWGRMQQEKC